MYAGWEGDSGNTLRGNTANDNARNGIYAFGATENTFEANKMFGNAILDVRDDARDRNIWIANQCVTDFPAGTSAASFSREGSLVASSGTDERGSLVGPRSSSYTWS